MKLLWIGKSATDGRAGDEVFDRRMIATIRALGVDIAHVAPQSATRLRQAWGFLEGLPHNRALYNTPENRFKIQRAAANCQAAIISWEPFDCFVSLLRIPVVAVLHNITSQSLVAARPGNAAAALLARVARSWEEKCYAQDERLVAVAALSRADEALVRDVRQGTVLYTPPGMPPPAALGRDAVFTAEILLEGTYDWAPKRRDIDLFAVEYQGAGGKLPIRSAGIPSSAVQRFASPPPRETRPAIRLGIITDRFKSGFKLKSTAYIANNCVVLSYADIFEDFSSIPDASFFVRRISHAQEIDRHVSEIGSIAAEELVGRFKAFQLACNNMFSWQTSAKRLLAPLETAVDETVSSRGKLHTSPT